MKRKNIVLSITIMIALIIIGSIVIILRINNNKEKPQKVQRLDILHGEKFLLVEDLKEKYIIDYQLQDINNDNIKDDVILVGSKENQDDVFSKGLYIVIRDGSTGKYNKMELKKLEGYECHIALQDVTNDNILDIIISVDKGGNKNIRQYNIIEYKDDKFKKIFDIDDCDGIKINGNFLDNYEAEISIKDIRKKKKIDIKDKEEYYKKKNIYDDKNALIDKEINITSYPISMLEKIYIENGNVGIKTTQIIIGIDKIDTIDVIETIWQYQNSKFEIFSIEGQRIGKIL